MPQHDPHSSESDATRRLSEQPDSARASASDVVPVDDDLRNDDTTPWSHDPEDISETVHPPSMPRAVSRPASRSATPFGETLPNVGETIDDFELIQELGRGAMGVVFLARQISLGRQVALKVSKNIGDEAQTMASLEHRHIVQVFSEIIIANGDQRLLCMQFVPGVTLEKVIERLRTHSATPMTGRRFIDIVDDAQRGPALLDPDALHDRLLLTGSNREEVVCRIGIWLSEALEYAHRRGVLHRDIKPANILVDPYGHPRLADFSLSARAADDEDAGDALFGGTLNYMAPEHLLAFLREIDEEEVDQRSDIYGLGLVLFELMTLHLPLIERRPDDPLMEHVRRLLDFRALEAPSLREYVPETSAALERTMRRCLDPDPDLRIASAAELATALRGCLQLRETEKSLPPRGRILDWFERWPLGCIIAVTLLPQLAGSVFNIVYNNWIVNRMNDAQQATFMSLVGAYNLIVYPICILVFVKFVVWPALRFKRALDASSTDETIDFDVARRRSLNFPLWAALLAAVGWFPGAVLFPVGLHFLNPPVTMEQASHFVMSIVLSGLIALTYSVVGLQLISLRYYYPQLWDNAEDLHSTSRIELRRSRRLNWISQILAGSIPLLGAALSVIVQGKDLTDTDYHIYQGFILWLIVLGGGGFQLALYIGQKLTKTIDAMTGRDDDPE